MKKNAVVITDNDNVATALVQLKTGQQAVIEVDGAEMMVPLLSDVPFGHKLAIRDIPYHAQVIKYGESIGRATRAIRLGEHVHVENVESERGRGDWTKANAAA